MKMLVAINKYDTLMRRQTMARFLGIHHPINHMNCNEKRICLFLNNSEEQKYKTNDRYNIRHLWSLGGTEKIFKFFSRKHVLCII